MLIFLAILEIVLGFALLAAIFIFRIDEKCGSITRSAYPASYWESKTSFSSKLASALNLPYTERAFTIGIQIQIIDDPGGYQRISGMHSLSDSSRQRPLPCAAVILGVPAVGLFIIPDVLYHRRRFCVTVLYFNLADNYHRGAVLQHKAALLYCGGLRHDSPAFCIAQFCSVGRQKSDVQCIQHWCVCGYRNDHTFFYS